VNEREKWLAYADTEKQVALAEPARPRRKTPLAVLPLEKAGPERPESAIREIPASLSPDDPRSDESKVPPLDLEVDLD